MNYRIAFFQWSVQLILELNLIWNLLLLIMLILRLHIGIILVLLYCILNFIISALVFQTCICSCCCCTFIKVWRYCGLFSALPLLLNTLRGLKKELKCWFKFVVRNLITRKQIIQEMHLTDDWDTRYEKLWKKYQLNFSSNGWYIQLLSASIWYRFYSPLQVNENMQLK